MTAVATLLAGIKTQSKGLTDLCAGHLQQSIRHVQRNCEIECSAHEEEDALYDCKQPDRYDGARMAEALASIPRLVAALEAVAKMHFRENDPDHSYEGSCVECIDTWPCPTITAVVAALGEDAMETWLNAATNLRARAATERGQG